MKAENLSDIREARARVEESDQRRRKFIRDMVGKEWTDALNYHLCLDSSAVGLPKSVQMIIGLVKNRRPAEVNQSR
jgi:hypothetical protein